MKRECGVTLIEMMVAVAVLAVVAAFAVPNLRYFLIHNRTSSISMDLMSTLNYARSEAVKRGTPVTVCRSSTGTSCGGSWSNGWITFVDKDKDGVVDAGETKLRTHGTLTTKFSVGATLHDANSGAAVNFVTYLQNGTANDTGEFAVCFDNDRTNQAKAIEITLTRPRVETDTNGNGIPDDGTTDINSCSAP